jgi:NADH-quinone oxidoreductase subunit N
MLLAYAAVRSGMALTGLLYMAIAYLFMQSAVFLLLDLLRRKGMESLEEIAGLGGRSPVLSLFFTLQLFSLAGIPLLAGFLGKAILFYAGVDAGLWWAVLIALLNSALSVAYYAWIVKQLWFDEFKGAKEELLSANTLSAQVILLAGTLWFGIFAGTVFAAVA